MWWRHNESWMVFKGFCDTRGSEGRTRGQQRGGHCPAGQAGACARGRADARNTSSVLQTHCVCVCVYSSYSSTSPSSGPRLTSPSVFSSCSAAGVRPVLQRGPEERHVLQRPAGGHVRLHRPAVREQRGQMVSATAEGQREGYSPNQRVALMSIKKKHQSRHLLIPTGFKSKHFP